MEQFNVSQDNMEQFNKQSENANARDAQRTADVNKANASILNQVSQFNAQLDFNRQQWNAANEQAVVKQIYLEKTGKHGRHCSTKCS